MKYFLLLFLSTTLVSCKTYSEYQESEFDKEIKAYMKENNLELDRSSSGLYYEIQNEGEGRLIQFTDMVKFKYKGELLDGTVFDNQMEEPVEFQVKQLIGAWKEIMLELKEGGKAFLIAPPQLGYGTRDLDDIPANSILVFTLEVVEVN